MNKYNFHTTNVQKMLMQEAHSKVIYMILSYSIINILFHIFELEIQESISGCFNIEKSNIRSSFLIME